MIIYEHELDVFCFLGVASCGSVTLKDTAPPGLRTADPLGPGLGVKSLGTDPLLFGDLALKSPSATWVPRRPF